VAPDTGTALIILAVFVLPGFITLLMRERSFAVKGEDTPFERLLNALFYSALVYALVLGVGVLVGLTKDDLTQFYEGRKDLEDLVAAAAIIGLVLPLAIAEFGGLWRKSRCVRPWFLRVLRISPAHNVQSGWNQLFSESGFAFIRATLSDGRVVGGYYGPGSFAGYSEHTQDLFISERWELDDDAWFTERAPATQGLWIPRESLVSLEVYGVDEPADAALGAAGAARATG
jgi:hypothetical protein